MHHDHPPTRPQRGPITHARPKRITPAGMGASVMPRKKNPPPELEYPKTCPACGRTAEFDDYDCGGAVFGCLWCNVCGAHFHSVTEKLVPIPGSDGSLFV